MKNRRNIFFRWLERSEKNTTARTFISEDLLSLQITVKTTAFIAESAAAIRTATVTGLTSPKFWTAVKKAGSLAFVPLYYRAARTDFILMKKSAI